MSVKKDRQGNVDLIDGKLMNAEIIIVEEREREREREKKKECVCMCACVCVRPTKNTNKRNGR